MTGRELLQELKRLELKRPEDLDKELRVAIEIDFDHAISSREVRGDIFELLIYPNMDDLTLMGHNVSTNYDIDLQQGCPR